MKLLLVVQRYGVEVFGGAEQFTRKMATQLVKRGHEVEVASSCALSYYDWADHYEPGVSELEGVTVRRWQVSHPRNHEIFGGLNARVLTGWKPVPEYLQRTWMREQGPELPGFEQWMWDHATDYDAIIFNTYLYWPTWAGLPQASGRVPTVLHPLAHDEPSIFLPLFDLTFSLPSALAFLTEEEGELVKRRFGTKQPTAVTGIGMDLDIDGDEERFRKQYDVGDRPYIACVGRIDPHKGSDELFDFFVAYKERNPGPLALVVVGEPIKPLPVHDDVIVTGFVDESVKDDAVAGCLVSVQPSYFESFSMVLTEAWAQYKPALVNARSAVLEGQALRSGGALTYRGFAEFEAALDILLSEPDTSRRLAAAGRSYVERRYAWPVVMDRYERFLENLPAT